MSDVLSDDEIDALRDSEDQQQSAINQSIDQVNPADLVRYDLSSGLQELLYWSPQLQLIDGKIAHSLKSKLLGLLNKTADVEPREMQALKFCDYRDTLGVPTSINLYNLPLTGGRLVICVDSALVFSFVNCFFGGGTQEVEISPREFTRTEQRVTQRLLGTFIESVLGGWKELQNSDLTLIESESNPVASAAFQADDVVIVRAFKVAFEGGGGNIHLLVSGASFEQIMQPASPAQTSKKGTAFVVRRRIKDFKATVTGEISGASMTLGQLLEMSEGDIIPINSPDLVDVMVNGVRKFCATSGEVDGRVGLRIINRTQGNKQ